MFFVYGDEETNYLKEKDKKLGAIIDKIGHIDREINPDLFSSVIHSIVGQQISSKAHATIWGRLKNLCGEITPKTIGVLSVEELQSVGVSIRKASYIKDFAAKVTNGEFSLKATEKLSDEEFIAALTTLKGVGRWTAEMLLLFCLCRPNVLSFDDLGIRRGMCSVYRHRELTPTLFNKYKRRLSPFGSVAALYFWAVAGGAIDGLTPPAPRKK